MGQECAAPEALIVSPSSFDFGETGVEERQSAEILVSNLGAETFDIGIIQSGSSDFTVTIDGAQIGQAVLADPDGDGEPGLRAGGTFTLEVSYLTSGPGADQGQLTLLWGLSCATEVLLTATAVLGPEPEPNPETCLAYPSTHNILLGPLDVAIFDAEVIEEIEGLELHWAVVNRPEGSVSALVEEFLDPANPVNGGAPDDPSTPRAQLFIDSAGLYVVELRLLGPDGEEIEMIGCPNPPRVEVNSLPREGLWVDLRWRTFDDPNEHDGEGTDLDVYLRHPTGDDWQIESPLLCSWRQNNPDWGAPGREGDCGLLIDDVNGAGPEIINVPQPEPTEPLGGLYEVGLNFSGYSSPAAAEYGGVSAQVRVYFDGVLAWENDEVLGSPGAFWHPAGIAWSAEPDGRRAGGAARRRRPPHVRGARRWPRKVLGAE